MFTRTQNGPREMFAAVVVLLIVVCAVLPALLTGALAPQLRRSLGIGPIGIGLGATFFFGAGAIGSVLFGRATEKIGPVVGLQMTAILSSIGSLGIAFWASDATQLYIFLAVSGLANALSHPAGNVALLQVVAPQRHGLVFGIKQSAAPVAGLFAGVAVPVIALSVGWRYAFALGGGGALVGAVLVSWAIPRPLGFRRARKTVRRLTVGTWQMTVLTIAAGLGAMATNSLAAFLVLTGVNNGLGEASAGLLLSLSSVAGITVRIGAGWFADHAVKGRLNWVAIFIFAGALGFGLLAIPTPATTIVGGLLGFGLGWGWPGVFNLVIAQANPEAPASATAFIQTGTYVGAATGPLLFGALAEGQSFSLAWLTMAVIALIASGFMIIGRRGLIRERIR